MNQFQLKLIESASRAASACGSTFGRFQRDGFADFLAERMQDDKDPLDIAVNLLEELWDCPHKAVVALTTLLFLQETAFKLENSAFGQCAADLKNLMDGEPSRDDFITWADKWYNN